MCLQFYEEKKGEDLSLHEMQIKKKHNSINVFEKQLEADYKCTYSSNILLHWDTCLSECFF